MLIHSKIKITTRLNLIEFIPKWNRFPLSNMHQIISLTLKREEKSGECVKETHSIVNNRQRNMDITKGSENLLHVFSLYCLNGITLPFIVKT